MSHLVVYFIPACQPGWRRKCCFSGVCPSVSLFAPKPKTYMSVIDVT